MFKSKSNFAVITLILSLQVLTGLSVGQELIVSVPPYHEVEEARMLNVTCVLENISEFNGTVGYRWSKLEDEDWESSGANLVILDCTILLGGDCEVYSASGTVTEDAGYYRCEVAVTEGGSVKTGSDDMHLVILYFARWVNYKLDKYSARIGETAQLECHVHSQPECHFYWEFLGQNISTSTQGKSVLSEENVSVLNVYGVTESDFGTYICHAVNSQGDKGFDVQLRKPGIPDSPQICEAMNVTAHNVTIHCLPGYKGGESLQFYVEKESPHVDRIEAEFTQHEEMNIAEIIVKRLDPNVTWTLILYQQNKHGLSEEGVGVSVRTLDGPPLPPEDKFPIELVAIITGTCAGVLLIIVIITVIACCVVRKSPTNKLPRDADTRPTLSPVGDKKNAQNYVMEDDHDNASNLQRENSQRFNRQNSWGSFKRKKPLKPLSGVANPNYVGSSSSLNRQRPANYDGQSSPNSVSSGGNFSPYVISLSPAPGESSDYENAAYVRDSQVNRSGSQETSFTAGVAHPQRSVSRDSQLPSLNTPLSGHGVDPEVELRRQLANPIDRANKLSKGQPSLAGMGALSFMQNPKLKNYVAAPLTPSVTPTTSSSSAVPLNCLGRVGSAAGDTVSLHIRPPSFIPEVPWEFPKEKLYIRKKLGDGSFGEVWRAGAEGILGRAEMQVVAVKMLKERYTPEEKRALLKELGMLKVLQPHPNIISLLGCCTSSAPICLIMEYAENGNLQDLLRQQRIAFEMNDLNSPNPRKRGPNFKLRDLTIFSLHVASGMEYISSQNLLHRDLAARNVLVDEHMICKICDFGSARDITDARQYESKSQRRMPMRWMAPESLYQNVYSIDSDVWSFGVLLWEILTIGSTPYPGMSGQEVMQFIQKGCRMAKPKHCSDAMYAIMKDCWNQFPPKRPSFSIIRHRLTAILDEPNSDLFVDQLEDNIYDIIRSQPGEKC